MNYDTHKHVGNRIFRRSTVENQDGLWVELEEGSQETHLENPIRLREFESKKLLGHIRVLATVQGNTASLKYFPRRFCESLFTQLLIRSGAEILRKKIEGKISEPDFGASIAKTLVSRYPLKKSVDWFTFYVFNPPYELKMEEEPDFVMHDHTGPIIAIPNEFKKIKEGEIGNALAQGLRAFDYEEDTDVVDVSHKKIGTALVLLSIQTRIDIISKLIPVLNLPMMMYKAERSPATIIRRQISILYHKKSDSKWFTLICYLPKSVTILNRLVSQA